MILIDTHAHLTMGAFQQDLEEVIQRARDAGVERIIDIGTDVKSSRRVIQNSERFDEIFGVVGIHPHDVSRARDGDLLKIEKLLDHPKVVALGETGLDYHYDFSPRQLQKEYFKNQLELARDKSKPVVIHIREAMPDGLQIIDDIGDFPAGGVFHCFGGSVYDVPRVIERGFYISLTGVITFKNFRKADLVKSIPVNRLLLETDAPYMTPVPLRGKRNEPAFITYIANVLSQVYGTDIESLADQTSENARTLFNLTK